MRTPVKYAIVIEKVPGSNYSAYVPDLPGCIATAGTLEEIKQLMREGIEFHLEGMREDGDPIPEPTTQVAMPRLLEAQETMNYTVLIEKGPASYGAHVPDLPGCVAVAETRQEVEQLIKGAIEMHLKGMREDGDRFPSQPPHPL